MNIRECQLSDIDVITNFTLALYQHEKEPIIKPHPNLYENLRKWLTSEIKSDNSLLLLAEMKNKPLGFISASIEINDNGFVAQTTKGVIRILWVEPLQRNKKVADNLLNVAELCLKETGVHYIDCAYVSTNQLALNFWNNRGYTDISVTCRKVINTHSDQL